MFFLRGALSSTKASTGDAQARFISFLQCSARGPVRPAVMRTEYETERPNPDSPLEVTRVGGAYPSPKPHPDAKCLTLVSYNSS
jgi:hypothetical protein